jgi:hypothetical protein
VEKLDLSEGSTHVRSRQKMIQFEEFEYEVEQCKYHKQQLTNLLGGEAEYETYLKSIPYLNDENFFNIRCNNPLKNIDDKFQKVTHKDYSELGKLSTKFFKEESDKLFHTTFHYQHAVYFFPYQNQENNDLANL